MLADNTILPPAVLLSAPSTLTVSPVMLTAPPLSEPPVAIETASVPSSPATTTEPE